MAFQLLTLLPGLGRIFNGLMQRRNSIDSRSTQIALRLHLKIAAKNFSFS